MIKGNKFPFQGVIAQGLPFRGGYGLHLKFADDTVLFLEDNDTFGNVLSIKFLQVIFDFQVNSSKSDLAGLIVDSYVVSSIVSLDVVKLYGAPSHTWEFLWVVILFYFFWKSWDYSDLCSSRYFLPPLCLFFLSDSAIGLGDSD